MRAAAVRRFPLFAASRRAPTRASMHIHEVARAFAYYGRTVYPDFHRHWTPVTRIGRPCQIFRALRAFVQLLRVWMLARSLLCRVSWIFCLNGNYILLMDLSPHGLSNRS